MNPEPQNKQSQEQLAQKSNQQQPTQASDGSDSGSTLTSDQKSDFTVIWHNLTCRVETRRWITRIKHGCLAAILRRAAVEDEANSANKVILDGLCGYAKSRQLTAIMGPSGAGKSTLLKCLFQSQTQGATGEILVEGRQNNRNKLKVCFIPQHDYLNEWLTVREDLIFVSKLKSARMNGFLAENSSTSSSSSASVLDSLMQSTSSSPTPSHSIVVSQSQDCASSTSTTSQLIDHEFNAIRVSGLLGLSNCLDVQIKNISGGQKKRLSIARELMSNPDILVMDEPTTGLDSLTCLKTIKILRDLAHSSTHPMAIVVTIHQPQREVFNLFDTTYFISNEGKAIYNDSPEQAVRTLESVANLKLPFRNYNPASFLIEIAADVTSKWVLSNLATHLRSRFYQKYDKAFLKQLKTNNKSNNSSFRRANFEDKMSFFSDFSLSRRIKANHATSTFSSLQLQARKTSRTTIDDTTVKFIDNVDSPQQDNRKLQINQLYIAHPLRNCLSSHSNNSLTQSISHIFILTHRSWLSYIRNPSFTKSRLLFHTLLPLVMLAVYGGKTGNQSDCPTYSSEIDIVEMTKSIRDGVIKKNVDGTRLSLENISFFFILLYGFGINLISCTASLYPQTIHMFKKETINGLYSAGPYFIGQMIAELPLEMFYPTLSILISYPLTGQLSSHLEWRMFTIAFITFLVCYSMHAIGLLCGGLFVNNISVAVLLGQVLLLPQVMLSGCLIRPTRMSDLMLKMSYTSPFRHGMMAIVTARYGFNSCDCDQSMLPEDGVKLAGLSPNVKHVIEYLFPRDNSSNSVDIVKIFEQLGDTFVKSQSFGLDVKTCQDVKPHLMHIYGLVDMDLFVSIASLILIIIVLKVVTFSLMKTLPSRIN